MHFLVLVGMLGKMISAIQYSIQLDGKKQKMLENAPALSLVKSNATLRYNNSLISTHIVSIRYIKYRCTEIFKKSNRRPYPFRAISLGKICHKQKLRNRL